MKDLFHACFNYFSSKPSATAESDERAIIDHILQNPNLYKIDKPGDAKQLADLIDDHHGFISATEQEKNDAVYNAQNNLRAIIPLSPYRSAQAEMVLNGISAFGSTLSTIGSVMLFTPAAPSAPGLLIAGPVLTATGAACNALVVRSRLSKGTSLGSMSGNVMGAIPDTDIAIPLTGAAIVTASYLTESFMSARKKKNANEDHDRQMHHHRKNANELSSVSYCLPAIGPSLPRVINAISKGAVSASSNIASIVPAISLTASVVNLISSVYAAYIGKVDADKLEHPYQSLVVTEDEQSYKEMSSPSSANSSSTPSTKEYITIDIDRPPSPSNLSPRTLSRSASSPTFGKWTRELIENRQNAPHSAHPFQIT